MLRCVLDVLRCAYIGAKRRENKAPKNGAKLRDDHGSASHIGAKRREKNRSFAMIIAAHHISARSAAKE